MSEFASADSALDDVLGESPAPVEVTPDGESDHGASDAHVGETSTTDAPDHDESAALDFPEATTGEVTEADWLCSEAEARQMVDRARAAITELDSSLRQIIERRAWEPLGYADPKEFVLAELGPSAVGGKSKAQAYRLARLAMFLYGLAEAFGDESVLLDISERSLRAIPPGASGENDEVLTERVASRIEALDDPTEEAATAVWEEEYERARDEIAETGRLARADEGDDHSTAGGDQWDEIPDGGEYEDDTFSLSDVTGGDSDDDSDDEDVPEWETQSTSRLDYSDVHGIGDKPSEATLTYVEALRELMSALAVVSENNKHLPDIVQYASDEEITTAAELAATTDAMTKALIAEAEERDDEFTI